MYSTSILLLALLSLAAGVSLELRSRRSLEPYHGPTAPINHDGTVANTPEVQFAKAAHDAAHAEEYRRLHETESLAKAHPDLTSPPHGQGASSGSYNQYKSGLQTTNSALYNQGTSYKYNPEARVPAPLNSDGTVAHTAEYRAIADSHHAQYQQRAQSVKHQAAASYLPHQPAW